MARAEGTVNIEVKGALQGALEVKTLSKALAKLDSQGQKLQGTAKTVQTVTQSFLTHNVKTRKVFDSFDKGIKMMGTGMTKFLGLALKTTLIQFGAFSAALIGIHALFVAGKWLHKAYSWGMTAMAGAAASAAVALGTAAAAIREQQAAMYAFSKGGAGEFVSGTNQARNAMRTLQADAQLAGIGVAGLNKAYAAMAKSMKSSQIAQSGAMLKKLMDFGSAGQDPAAAADKVGALIEALNNSKTSMAKVKEAAKALGPQMEAALKKAKVTSKKQMKELIMSGELAKAGGVAGQFDAVNSTLIGKAKAFFTQIKGEFADFGQQFLGPAKEAMEKIFRIIRRDLLRVSDSLADFGAGKYMDGLVGLFEKVSGFFVKLIREWLPKTDGFFSKMGNWWDKVTRWFRITKENLKPFVEGAKSIELIFKPILEALKSGFLNSFKNFNTNAINSKKTFEEIGNTLGGLITELFKLQQVFSDAFREALPFLSDVVKGITQVVQMMTGLLSKFSGLAGGPMAYMGMMILFRQMKSHSGGFLGKERAPLNTMTITAQTVYVGGQQWPPKGPGPQPPGTPPVRPTPGGPPQLGPGRTPPQLGPGRTPPALGPGGGGMKALPAPMTGPIRYDKYGSPLYGGLRHASDTRIGEVDAGGRFVAWGKDYPNPNAKLVGRAGGWKTRKDGTRYWNSGLWSAKTPGTGKVGITGQGGLPYPGAPASPIGGNPYPKSPMLALNAGPTAAGTAGATDSAIQAASGATSRRVIMMQQRYQNLAPGVERDQAAAWLTSRGHPLAPAGGMPTGGTFSSGATPPPGAPPGGGMPGPGGPGTAPPGAGGPGMSGAYSRPGLFGRISSAMRAQAGGQTGLGQDLFRTKTTGRQYARAEVDPNLVSDTNKEGFTGRVLNMKGQHVANYDAQTGFTSTKGFGLKSKARFMGQTTRSIRNSKFGSAILGNADKGISGINNSMGAKMAVGMGMSMLSQKMAPEAQGAMALGGMVGQYNPLAGLAVGFGGAALKSRTAKGGAVTGAAAGAAIGTMIAPGVGTAVGAALGAITGAIMGWRGGMNKRAKEAKQAVNTFLDAVSFSEFQKASVQLRRNEERAARGESLAGERGALQDIAMKTAGKYSNVASRFKGIDMDFQKRNDQKALNFGRNKKGFGWNLIGQGQGWFGQTMRHLTGQSTLGLVSRLGSKMLTSLGSIPGMGAVSKIPGMGWMTGNKNLDDDQKKALSQIEQLRKDPAFKGLITDEEYKKIKKSPVKGLTEIGKQLPDRIEAATLIGKQTENRMKMLSDMSGKSGAELEILAKKMGVNLYDSTLKMEEVVTKLGLAVVKTSDEIKNLNIDSALKGITDGFDAAIKRANAPKIYDERGRQVYDVIKGGGDTGAVLEALKGFQESAMSMDSNPITAFYEQQKQIGTLQKPGKLFQKNGAWAKMDPSKFFTPEVSQALAIQAQSTEKGFIDTAAQQTTSMLANAGMMGNTNQISTMIQSMSAPNRERFLKDVQSGAFNIKDPFADLTDEQSKSLYTKAGFKSKEEYMANKVNTAFGSYGIEGANVDVMSINKDTNLVADKMTDASDTFKTAVDTFNSNMANYFTDSAGKPEWWSKDAMKEIMKGDTNTPRGSIVGDTTSSRLSQTMARHNAINGSIAGNRTITSGYRTYGLGSLNSDHLTGRAIDIVGQNLGSYAVATRNAGGFAEFHGSGADRHLHAVPGPGAIGDTLMPRSNQMGTATSATVTSGGSSFTFHINGGQNSPEEIANMVMAKIKTAEQRVRERI